ncbi:MAG TPA: glycosyltransferase family 2 protein [Anaerolineae bacterium]|nr:glycosyltransferase family 2 protein [Anaerolineae bacterium]
MSERSYTFSVVVCAYTEDRWPELIAAVTSLQLQTVHPHEIIVVVDHNPGLFARACTNLTGIKVIENHEPAGLSGARNSGLAAASGDLIAFMDEDAVAAPDWLARLRTGYADPCVLGVGGAIEPVWQAGRPRWFPTEFDWVVGCTYRGMPVAAAPVRNLIGCNMSFRREVFKLIDGFQTGIGRIGTRPVGCEETELCIRLHQRQPQGVLLYMPLARVHHQVPAGRGKWRYFLSRCYAEGLSKALVCRRVGTDASLSSERNYTLQTLPSGFIHYLVEIVRHHDPLGLARATALVLGLLFTTAGFMRGTLASELAVLGNKVTHRHSLADLAK